MLRGFLFLVIVMITGFLSTAVWAQESLSSIEIQGNRRVETPTVMSYIDIKPGQRVSKDKEEEILKNLFATGLFADVVIEQVGPRLLIKVVENKIINRIAFEGNDHLKDDILQAELNLKPREV